MASRAGRLVAKLKKFYGNLPAPPLDPFTLFVWEILSNHSSQKKRAAAMAALKKAGALTVDGMWTCPPRKIEESVALAGPYMPQRVQALKKGVEAFRRNPELPQIIKEPPPVAAFRALKGIPLMTGDGSGYRMLLFAGGQAVLPVDARVARVATRLGYGERGDNFPKAAKSIRLAMTPELGTSVAKYRDVYVCFDRHGAVTCTESHPSCGECPLLNECPFGQSREGGLVSRRQDVRRSRRTPEAVER
jgi:endonuclease III